MRVAIDANALGVGRGGDETYLLSLILGLAELVDDGLSDRFPLLLRPGVRPPPIVDGHPSFPVSTIHGPGPIRHAFAVPASIRGAGRVDLVHSIIHGPPVAPAPLALSIPDISFYRHPEYFPPLTRLRLNLLVSWQVRRARIVTTVSEFSRRDLIDAYGLREDRVFVIPNAVVIAAGACQASEFPHPSADHATSTPPPAGSLNEMGRPYFLYLGNLHPRKNVPRLIEAFGRARAANPAIARHQLVVAGASWWGGSAEQTAAAKLPPDAVRFLGRVTNEERVVLMRGAVALAYPSLFEGFGLPPLEAMALGTPAVASNVSAMPEVLGDAARLVDPYRTDDLAQALVNVATDQYLRRELTQRGIRRAARFTTRATGQAALSAFQAAVRLPAAAAA